jgi:replication initiation and membrane attachment protein
MATLKLYAPIDLSGHDHKVISLLYQPLIGQVAFSLYHFIFSLTYQKDVVSVNDMDMLNLLVITKKEFEDACNKLQAHVLLDVYESKEDILLQIKKPMTAKQFLTDTIFGITLEQKIGDAMLRTLVDQFKVQQPHLGYQRKDIHYDDVFDVDQVKKLSIDTPLFENGGVHAKVVKTRFPYETWVDQLPSAYKKPSLLKSTTRQLIENLVFIYQLNQEDLNQILTSIHPSQIVKNEAIKNAAKRYFEKHQILTIDDKKEQPFNNYSQISPLYIIQKYGKHDHQGIALDTITSLVERNHVDLGVINVLLVFVLKRKEGVLPHIHYLEKILIDWMSKGVTTSQDAIEMTTKLETAYQKKQVKKSVRVSVEPDWLDDYLAELKKEEDAL